MCDAINKFFKMMREFLKFEKKLEHKANKTPKKSKESLDDEVIPKNDHVKNTTTGETCKKIIKKIYNY